MVCVTSIWLPDVPRTLSTIMPYFLSLGMTVDGSSFDAGTGPRVLNNLQCTGNELRLLDCPSDPIGMPQTSAAPAALVCQESTYYDHKIINRLSGNGVRWFGHITTKLQGRNLLACLQSLSTPPYVTQS